ncbi:MAG: flagellar basal body protein [Pseudomonadota bacterium]
MPVTDMPYFQMVRSKMGWHQSRQSLLSENVANADTVGYEARDLAPASFRTLMQNAAQTRSIVPDRTHVAHITTKPLTLSHRPERQDDFEIRPRGNAVVLEEEMMKVTGNQMDFEAASLVYKRALGLMKTSIGRR